ncbi:hypothetical protein [Brevundimonas sp.]|uniref:hypothetical protein n=1 Tax=Brevundimonas sp. TaxID=1871086 RepID=UPI003F7271DE
MTHDPVRWLWAAAAVGLWLLVITLVRWSRARARRAAAVRSAALAPVGYAPAFLVAFASQTGLAEKLATGATSIEPSQTSALNMMSASAWSPFGRWKAPGMAPATWKRIPGY